MTRETKAGLVVAASFIGLMAAVLVKKFVFHTPSADEKALAQVTEKNGKASEATPIQPGKMDLVPVPPSGEIKLTTGDEKSPPPPDPTPITPPPPPVPGEKKEEGGIPPLPGVNDKSTIPAFPGAAENKGGIPPLPGGKEKEIPPVTPITTPATTIPPPIDPISPNPGGATSIPPAPPVGISTIPPVTNVPPVNNATPVIPPPPPGVGSVETVIPPPPAGGIPSLPMTTTKVEPVVPPPASVGSTIPPPPVAPVNTGLNSGTVPPIGLITPPPPPASIGNPALNSTSPTGSALVRSNGTTSFDAVEGPANRSEFIPSNSRVTPGVPTGYIPPATGGNGGFIAPMPGSTATPLGPNQIISAAPLNSSTPVPIGNTPGAVLTIPSSVNGNNAFATPGNNVAAATTPLAPKVESWTEQVYYCQPGDSYAAVSQKVYRNADYAKALQLWNENHPRNRTDAPKTGVLVPGQEVYYPPTSELSRKYGAYIPKLSPVSAGPGVGNTGVIPAR